MLLRIRNTVIDCLTLSSDRTLNFVLLNFIVRSVTWDTRAIKTVENNILMLAFFEREQLITLVFQLDEYNKPDDKHMSRRLFKLVVNSYPIDSNRWSRANHSTCVVFCSCYRQRNYRTGTVHLPLHLYSLII
jgi:hypothetical protein